MLITEFRYMVNAYKCDRCGKFEPREPPNTLKASNTKDGRIVLGDGYLDQTDHLCRDCGRAYEAFMDGKPMGGIDTNNGVETKS